MTRKLGESLQIGDDVVLQVCNISRGKVRLAFDAPRAVIIQRSEKPHTPVAESPTTEKGPTDAVAV